VSYAALRSARIAASSHNATPPCLQPKLKAQAKATTAPGEVATVEAQEGHVYIGSLKNGLRHGTGKMTRVNGATYEGEWHEGARHGTGHFADGTGTVYEGQFQKDKRHGKGKIVWSDGRIYDGDWEEDQRHGHGNFTDRLGNVYDGGFVRDALEGHGITHRVDGGSYEGEFVDGDRHGYGQFTGKDGDGQFVYQGNYAGNKRHGPVRSLRLLLSAPLSPPCLRSIANHHSATRTAACMLILSRFPSQACHTASLLRADVACLADRALAWHTGQDDTLGWTCSRKHLGARQGSDQRQGPLEIRRSRDP
jgi:hypothetical protein